MNNIVYLDDFINIYSKKNKRIIVEESSDILKKGKIINTRKFIEKFETIKKSNKLNTLVKDNIYIIINNSYDEAYLNSLKQIFENLNYNKINYIKEEDLINVNNKSIFINTSLNYFELLYYYGKELICDYFDLNELNLKILITIINFLNLNEIYLFGKNKNIVKSELINNQIKYYEYSSSENLYIKICLQEM